MAEQIRIEEVLRKKATAFGTSSHIILPKRYKDRNVILLVIDEYMRIPYVHYDWAKKMDGKVYYKAEITDGGGTHGFWIEKNKIKNTFIRNPEE